jgi:hypothetical protein
MTLQEIQEAISVEHDFTTATENVDSQEYKRRTNMINRAAHDWARAKNHNWTELFKETDLTTTGAATLTLPADFSFRNLSTRWSGSISIGDLEYSFVSPHEKQNFEDTTQIIWLTGNPSNGYTLNIQPTPDSGETLNLRYFSTNLATDTSGTDQAELVLGTDVTKCPDPEYMVMAVLATLFKTNEDPSLGVDYERRSIDILNDMIADSQNVLGQDTTVTNYQETGGFPPIGDK